MTAGDIAAGLTLCRSAGWNQLENDWKIFLELDPDGSRVAIDENGKVTGTVATVKYEDHFSWIGMVLVDPSKKRQGIGTQLLLQALDILSDQKTVKLDATPAGREVYLKLGFRDEYTLCRMMSDNISVDKSNAVNITENDFANILEKDKTVFGASRKGILKWIHKNYPEFSFVINKDSRISYAFGRKGFKFSQVGPVVADNTEEAIHVTKAVLKNVTGPVILDVMNDSLFYHWLVSTGFTEQRKLIRMYRGANKYPGIPGKQFAILGPEFG